MPIYEYHCQDCGAMLELLLDVDSISPKLCGFRCLLPRGQNDDLRGFGGLSQHLSAFRQASETSIKDTPSPEVAARAGFSTYRNDGGGTFTKIAGKEGPAKLKR